MVVWGSRYLFIKKNFHDESAISGCVRALCTPLSMWYSASGRHSCFLLCPTQTHRGTSVQKAAKKSRKIDRPPNEYVGNWNCFGNFSLKFNSVLETFPFFWFKIRKKNKKKETIKVHWIFSLRGLGSIFKKKGWSFSVDGVVVVVFETKDASSFHTLVEFIGWRSFGTTRVVEVWAPNEQWKKGPLIV